MTKTFSPTPVDIKHDWHLMDANKEILGRMASKIAILLMGKHKSTYAPHMVSGDHVVVINAEKIKVTGRKETQKNYYRHSGYPGGFRVTTLGKLREEHPERIIINAVSGMLPDNKLQALMLKNLHVYEGSVHPYINKFKS